MSPVCLSKKSAARRVGAVISSASRNHLRADDHWMRVSQPCMNGGRIATCCSMFSGIVWFVPTRRMPCFTAEVASPRPTTMCDWKWMTSGLIVAHDALGVRLHAPREHEAQPRVRQPAPAVDAVHGEVLADVLLDEGADLAALGGSHDVHVVTARREPGGEAAREGGRAVDVRRERVGPDEDAHRAQRYLSAGPAITLKSCSSASRCRAHAGARRPGSPRRRPRRRPPRRRCRPGASAGGAWRAGRRRRWRARPRRSR